MSLFWTDLRRAARLLTRERGLAVAAIVTLSVGIGTSTAMFSVVRGVLLRPMGIQEPERLLVMWPTVNDTPGEFSYNAYRDIARTNTTLQAVTITGSMNWPALFVLGGDPINLHGAAVSSTYFEVMGAALALGRTFRAEDDLPGARQVVVISDGVWTKYFNRDPAVLGRSIDVQEEPDAVTYEIVGVASDVFFYPHGADYWTPALPLIARSAAGAPLDPILNGLGVFHAVARLKPGQSLETAREDTTRLWQLRAGAAGLGDARIGVAVTSLVAHTFGRARHALVILMVAVLLVLFSACANVAGLLIARAASHAHQNAIRTALGATRWDLVRQALAEGLMLAVPGALLGVSVAAASLQALIALSPAAIPRLDTTALDAGVLAFAVAIMAFSTLLLTLAPAVSLSRLRPLHALASGKGTVGRTSRAGMRHALVVTQIAVGVVLLVATGLTVRSFVSLSSIDTGFHADHVLTFRVSGLEGTRYPDRAQRHEIAERLIERFTHVPGVQAAAAMLLRPFGAGTIGWDSGLWLEEQGNAADVDRRNPMVNFEAVTPGYFQAMGIPVRRGRDFVAADTADAPPVVIVSDNLAARLWPGEDPIGKRLVESFARGDGSQPPAWQSVVGVVGTAVYREIDRPRFDVYRPLRQAGNFDPDHFVLRTGNSPRSLIQTLGADVASVDAGFTLTDVKTMDEILAEVRGPWRFNMLVFALFGIVSIALTTIGLFSLVSYTVLQRRREFGIRLALGAEARLIRGMVLSEGAVLAAIGLVTGVAVAAALTRVIAGLLFETSPMDTASFVGASVVLAAVTMLACYIPARRAAAVAPAIVLREE